MPVVIILLLAALIATFGFWDTVQGILGAIATIVLIGILLAALAAAVIVIVYRRAKRRLGRQGRR